jgi:hypothetical protein
MRVNWDENAVLGICDITFLFASAISDGAKFTALDLSEPSLYARVDGGFGLIGVTKRG